MLGSNRTSTWIATAGPEQLIADLSQPRTGRWAVTGSTVAASIAPVAAREIAVIYTADVERLADAGRLLPSSTGANVILAEPYDPIVFARTTPINGAPAVSVAQLAADLLSGPARMPEEGDALVRWMRAHTARWQVPRLGS